MNKSPDAFRTISEVAEFLETPAHVLRFWESRFPQIRPVKRAGGRRYYRPSDVALLTGIKRLLHEDGMTIRGVQKILREQGVRYVAGVVEDPEEDSQNEEMAASPTPAAPPVVASQALPEAETAQIIALQAAARAPAASAQTPAAEGAEPFAPVERQEDPLEEDALADLTPEEPQPPVAEPAAPLAVPQAAPSVTELFPRPPAPVPSLPEPVAEAPMAVWAEEADTLEEAAPKPPSAAPVVHLSRLVPAETAQTPPTAPHETPRENLKAAQAGTTLAQRLRALSRETLSDEQRAQLVQLRDQAVLLRNRRDGSARLPG